MMNLSPYPTHAVIDGNAFEANFQIVRSLTGPSVKILAVVKANAYGHGAVDIARLALRQGAAYLGVSRVFEGTELREENIDAPILSFELVPRGRENEALDSRIDVTASSLEGACRLSDAAAKNGTVVQIHVKVDTGMARLGIPWTFAAREIASIALLPHVRLIGVYSHFATSELENQEFATMQLERFRRVLDELRKQHIDFPLRHIANTGAIMQIPGSHLDMVRPGLMLYGYTPREKMAGGFQLRPVLSLMSSVEFIKTVDKGTTISYGRKYVTERSTTIATVPIGYADGYLRLLTNRAEVLIRGRRYPVVGTVCMDQMMVDLGPDALVKEGDGVTLIGTDGSETITCWDLARIVGTIPYEITCLVTSRVPRLVRH